MSISVVLQQMGVIVILVAVGIYLYFRKIVDGTVSRKVSAIVMDICNPALVLSSILTGNITVNHKDLLSAILFGVGFYAILMVFGAVLPLMLGVKKDKRRFYNLMVVYTNVGFIGIPVAKAILPGKAIIYVIVCNIMYSLLFYTHGIIILGNGKEKMNLLKVFSPGTIMAILSLIVFWFNLKLPVVFASCISYIGNANVFLSMTLLGVGIARSGLANGIKNIRIWIYIIVRMILVPVLIFFILRALDFPSVTILGLCLMAAMPIGNLPLIQCEKMGEDTTLLSNAITVSTLTSLFTITGLMIFFTSIL